MPDSRIAGGCLCGAVHYEGTAEPLMLYACHCTDCQTVTGSAFVLAMRLPAGSVGTPRGTAKPYVRARADGRKKNIFRCPECLTALWSESLPASSYVTVYAGTLDDSSKLIPDGHLWTQDAQPWIVLPKDGLLYEQGPPDMEPFALAWKKRKSGPGT
jgi:hypothetical protein